MKTIIYIALTVILCSSFCLNGKAQQQSANALKNNAYFYMQQQQYDAAIETATMLPAGYDKNLLLGAAYLNKKDYNSATKWLLTGEKQYPDSIQFSILIVEGNFLQEDYEGVVQQFEKTLPKKLTTNAQLEALKPKVAYAYQKLAQGAAEEKNYALSERCYRKALTMDQSVQSYLGITLALLEQSKWPELIKYAQEGLAIYPKHPDLLGLLANAYFKTEDFLALQETYTKIYAEEPNNLQKALTLGEVMVANNDFDAAQQHYDLLLNNFAEEKAVYEAALQISSRFRNLESRLAILTRQLKFIPSLETAMELAETYQLAGDNWAAINLYDSLMVNNPIEIDIKEAFVKLYERTDSLEKISQKLEGFTVTHPESSYFKVALLKAAKAAKADDCSNALKLADKFFQVSNINLKKERAFIYQKCGRTAEGINLLQELIMVTEDTPDASVSLAKLSMTTDSLLEKRAGYLKIAANQLLSEIAALEIQIKNLNLMDPFNSYWLEVPAIKSRLDQYKIDLSEIMNLCSEQLPLAQSNQLVSFLKQEHPDNARLMFLSGQHYAFHRQKEKAKNHYEAAISLEPDLLEAQYEWARISEKANERQQAIAGYEKTLAINDQFAPGYAGLIRLYREKDQLGLLTSRWKLLYSNQQQNEVLKEALIEALHKQGRLEEAAAISHKNKELKN